MYGNKKSIAEIDKIRNKLAAFYAKPIYHDAIDNNINILIVDCGDEKNEWFWYLDHCLQFGQMKDYNLNICYICENPEERHKDYLEERPALEYFVEFKVNGEIVSTPEDYGKWANKYNINDESFYGTVSFVEKAEDSIKYNCIFHRKDDTKNVADAVNFGEILTENHYDIDPTENYSNYKENLDRMAENVHLAYNGSVNDIPTIEEFKMEDNGYYFLSSLTNAISIKYKLKSMKIDGIGSGLETEELKEAAKKFEESIKRSSKDYKGEFAALEHRRWLMEKATQGWTAPLKDDSKGDFDKLEIDYDECLKMIETTGKPHSDDDKKHICLVKSTAETKLSSFNWDTGDDSELDELDQISVKLYRILKSKKEDIRIKIAKELKKVQPLSEDFRENEEELSNAFDWYCYCVKNVLDSNRSYSNRYKYYKNDLESKIDTDSTKYKSSTDYKEKLKKFSKYQNSIQFEELIKEIDGEVKKYIAYNERIDYKSYDTILFDRIPFILTYRQDTSLIMAFDDGVDHYGETSKVFKNVASATILNPEKITYLINTAEHQDTELLDKKIEAIKEYFEKHHLQAAKKLTFKKITFSENDKDLEFIDKIEENENTYFDTTTKLYDSPWENTKYINKCRERFKCFETDFDQCRIIPIEPHNGERDLLCDELGYIRTNPRITVDDMFSLASAKIENEKLDCDSYVDSYEILWNICTGKDNTGGEEGNTLHRESCMAWNALFNFEKERNGTYKSNNYQEVGWIKDEKKVVLDKNKPENNGIISIIDELINAGILEAHKPGVQDEQITFSYKDLLVKYLILHSSKTNRKYDLKLLGDNYLITSTEVNNPFHKLIDVINKKGDEWGNFISVLNEYETRLQCEKKNLMIRFHRCENYEDEKNILGNLANNNFINLISTICYENYNNNYYSLTAFYPLSEKYERIFAKAGEVLELFVYYEAMKQGTFDDVSCSCTVDWGVKNELDLICVKGFKSLIAECKLWDKFNSSENQNIYHKLLSLTQQFGLSSHKAIIATLHDDQYNISADRITRGIQMNIPTITGQNINFVGEELAERIKKPY